MTYLVGLGLCCGELVGVAEVMVSLLLLRLLTRCFGVGSGVSIAESVSELEEPSDPLDSPSSYSRRKEKLTNKSFHNGDDIMIYEKFILCQNLIYECDSCCHNHQSSICVKELCLYKEEFRSINQV